MESFRIVVPNEKYDSKLFINQIHVFVKFQLYSTNRQLSKKSLNHQNALNAY